MLYIPVKIELDSTSQWQQTIEKNWLIKSKKDMVLNVNNPKFKTVLPNYYKIYMNFSVD